MATADEDDIAARFAAIVSPIAPTMNWNADPEDTDVLQDATAGQSTADLAAAEELRLQRERDERRELRRLERARELAEYNAERAQLEAEYNSDDDHFTPPEPPPLPRLRPATVGAVVLIIAGIALVAVPTLLVIDTQVTMIFGLVMIAGGAIALLLRLRHHDDDFGNGAVL